MLEREHIVYGPGAVFNCVDVAFNFSDMFVIRHDVELYLQVSDVTTERLELAVTKNNLNLESASMIKSNDGGDVFHEGRVFHGVELGGRAEFQVLGDANEKGDGVNFHHVNGDLDMTILGHDFMGKIGECSAHTGWLSPDGLAFKRSQVRSEDSLCVFNVLHGDGAIGDLFILDVPKKILNGGTTDSFL